MKSRKFKGRAKRGSFQKSVMRTHKFNIPNLAPVRGGIRL